jgi:hypothetical protein
METKYDDVEIFDNTKILDYNKLNNMFMKNSSKESYKFIFNFILLYKKIIIKYL